MKATLTCPGARTKTARIRLGLVIVLTTLLAVPAAAQTPVSSFADLHGRLTRDQTIYVQTAEVTDEYGRGIKGKVLDLSASALRLLVNGQSREFSERDALVVSERRTSAAKGALIGLAVGGGLGLWAVAECGGDPETCGWAQYVLGLAAGSGALVGGLIGRSIEHEHVLFLAPDLRQSRLFNITPFVGSRRRGLAATLRF